MTIPLRPDLSLDSVRAAIATGEAFGLTVACKGSRLRVTGEGAEVFRLALERLGWVVNSVGVVA